MLKEKYPTPRINIYVLETDEKLLATSFGETGKAGAPMQESEIAGW